MQQAQGACVPVQAWRSQGAVEAADAYEAVLDVLLARGAEAVTDLAVSATTTFSTGT